MKELRKGTSYIKSNAESSGGNPGFTPFISWKEDDVKYLAFLTPAEEIPQVRVHNFVEIPTEDGKRFATFMCRKDPAWREESQNECKLCDYIGHKAQERHVALAVELEPTQFKGKKPVEFAVKTRETDDGRQFPLWGLVIQSSQLFFNRLAAFNEKDPLEEAVYEVARSGTGLDTDYFFYAYDGRPDLEDHIEAIPEMDDLLEHMGSATTYEEELANVQPGSQRVWGDKKNSNATARPSPLSSFADIKRDVEARQGSQAVESY